MNEIPINVEGDIKNQVITNLQVNSATLDIPTGTVGSGKQVEVVLENGKTIVVRAFTDGKSAFLRSVLQKNVLQQDTQDVD